LTHHRHVTIALERTAGVEVVDSLARPLRDVRISVTDRCNFRCTYCMPKSSFGPGHSFLPRSRTMTATEIGRLAAVLVRLGVRKVRLTGGEPLLRSDLEDVVGAVRGAGVEDVALTTNGSLLAGRAPQLRAAGLHRITVSLDSLDPAVHRQLSDSGVALDTVLAGIAAARAAGFAPLKLNAVVRRGVNDAGILALVEYARAHGDTMRFIEYMDVGESNQWSRTEVVTGAEILAVIERHHPLDSVDEVTHGEVARRHRFRDGGGEVGLITSVSEPFCGSCTRLRISADGQLFTCLFATTGTDVLGVMRATTDDGPLETLLRRTWSARADRYSELRSLARVARPRVEMSYIGG
jgi:cyclic pyranopterin phosphate synthase